MKPSHVPLGSLALAAALSCGACGSGSATSPPAATASDAADADEEAAAPDGSATATEAPPAAATPGASPAESELSASGADSSIIDMPVVGFRIQPPEGWTRMPSGWQKRQNESIDFGSEEFNALVRQHASEPLLVLLKDPEVVSATVKVTLRPLGSLAGLSPRELGETMADQMEQTMEWFELDGEVETTTVGGLPAASMGTQLAMQLADGTVVEVTSRSHLIPRGRALFIVGLSRPIDDEAAGGELQRVLDSIQIDP